MQEAMQMAGTKGITETIDAALREFVRRKRLEKLAATLGKVDLAMSDEELGETRER